jgi:hypothetical protein
VTALAKRQPCEHCPWRVGVDAWAIGRDHSPQIPALFRESMEDLAERRGDGFSAPIMACHLTFRDEQKVAPQDRVCAGYVLTVGIENLNLRMLAISGKIDPNAFECAVALHPTFDAMLEANPPRPGGARP